MTRRDSSEPNTSSRPIRRSTDRTPSQTLFGHFTSLANSVQRRLSGGPPSSPSSSTDDNPHSLLQDRHHELDPPLAPISLHGFSQTTYDRVMTDKFAEEIRLMMPTRLQLQDHWDLVYSLEQHGVSMATLYARSKVYRAQQAGYVVIVRDRSGNVFGGYLSEYPHVHPHYYGTGECFLFKFKQLPPSTHHNPSQQAHLGYPTRHSSKSPSSSEVLSSSSTEASSQLVAQSHLSALHSSFPSTANSSHLSISTADTTRPSSASSDGPHYQFKGFSYTGLNDYMILCTPQFLSIGGGDGKYGLFLDDVFENGISSRCPAFGNEPLSDTGEKFKIDCVEVWRIGGSGATTTGFVYE